MTTQRATYYDIAGMLGRMDVWTTRVAACFVNGINPVAINDLPNIEERVWARTMWMVAMLNCNLVQKEVAMYAAVERSSVAKAKLRHETLLQVEPDYRIRWEQMNEML